MLHAFDILAQGFAQEGSDTCFALMGDANMAFATRLSEAGVRMIYVRHEHCAVAAAMAYARKTGKVGLATVTCGPGLTQLMTALPAAVRAHIPMVVFAGEAPLKAGWYNQEIDQAPFVAATGAAYHSLHWPDRMPMAVRDAFIQARRESRPVVLGVPFDLQELPWTGSTDLPPSSQDLHIKPGPMPPNPGDLTEAVKAVKDANRIVVMAGLGATAAEAGDACRTLAEKIDGLLATTLPARGLFHDDPFSIGIAGGFSSDIAREMLGKADLVIAVGASLAQHNSDKGKLWPNARVLQIDTDPVAVSQGRVAADLHLRADARLGVEALNAAISPRTASWRSTDLVDRVRTEPADASDAPSEPDVHDPRCVVTALDAAIPADWQLVNSSGHCSYYFAQMPRRPFDTFLTIREFGAIGNGTSFAMGVAAACPDTPVVLFDGDGSLLMHVQELETIQRHGLKIMIVVLNDGAYGSEIHKLRAEGLSDAGAVFGRTDLAGIARGFGMDGARVEVLSTIEQHIETFSHSDRAMLLDIPISDKIMSPVIRRSHGAG
jgi:thiamine pyrophosphate-dependent acetolactate synthase large subunit-like protein